MKKNQKKTNKQYIKMVTFTGHLGKDAEVIKGKDGSFVVLSMAVSFAKDLPPIWFRCTTSELTAQELEKGDCVTITGEMYQTKYKDYITNNIKVDEFEYNE